MSDRKEKIVRFLKEHPIGVIASGVLTALIVSYITAAIGNLNGSVEGKILTARIKPNNVLAWKMCPEAELELAEGGRLGTRCSPKENFEYLNNHSWSETSQILSIMFVSAGGLFSFHIDQISKDIESSAIEKNVGEYTMFVKWK